MKDNHDLFEIAYAKALKAQAEKDMKAYNKVQRRRNAAWDRTGVTDFSGTGQLPKLHNGFTTRTMK